MPTSMPEGRMGGFVDRFKTFAPLPWAISATLLIASGIVQGRLSGRWSTSDDLTSAVTRLDQLPREIGTWKGEDADVDRATLTRVGISGGIVRRYRDTRTGSLVTLMLVCGRPGPVSVHTPDVCYEGAGYELAAPPAKPFPDFLAATMVRPDAALTDRLQIFWSWNASDHWEVPENPRIAFGARPYLYKLYVIRSSPSAGEDLGSSPAGVFAKALTSTFDLRPDRR